MATFAYYSLLTLLITVAVLLILLILIQKGRGGGLSSSFGGGGGSSAFGAKTGDVLTWATSIIFGVFILLAVALDLVVDGQYKSPLANATTVTPAGAINTEPNKPEPAQSSPTPPPALPSTRPAATSAAGTLSNDLSKLSPATQTITNAATQGTAAVKTTTQPAGNLLKGSK